MPIDDLPKIRSELPGAADERLTVARVFAGPRAVLAMVLAAALATPPLAAWDSPGGQTPVPEHRRAWLEAHTPDPLTAWLWKFSTDQDTVNDLDELADHVAESLLAEDAAAAGAGPEAVLEPRLEAGAEVVTDAGRFGGGLVLDGSGFAHGQPSFPDLLEADGGFTLDFWFRRDATSAATKPETLVSATAADGRLLFEVRLDPAARVTVLADGAERLAVPLEGGPGIWRHLVLAVAADKGRVTDFTLMVGRHTATDVDPRWLARLADGPGGRLAVGGGPRLEGLHGAVDEVRLQRGQRRFYLPEAPHQELAAGFVERPVAPPFFRHDAVRLRLRFDGTTEPEVGAGVRQTGRLDRRNFQPGLRGLALNLSRIRDTGLAFQDTDLFPNLTGTVEFWMRPLDWNNFYVGDYHGRDVRRLELLTLTPPDSLRYSHDDRGRPTQVITAALGRSGGGARGNWTKIHPGTWTHVLVSVWGRDRRQSVVYLNGVPRGHVGVRFSDSLRGNARRADDAFGPGELAFQDSGTLIDEFSAYPWAMNGDEAWNAYARWLPDADARMRPFPPFTASLQYVAHAWNGRERIDANVSWLSVDGRRPTTVSMVVQDAQDVELSACKPQPTDMTGNVKLMGQGALPFGHYTAIFRGYGPDGSLLGEERVEYERQQPEWYGNTLGLERTVPSPWTPLGVEKDTVTLWGREVVLGPGGLPARITTLGLPVLAAPAEVAVSGPAGTHVLAGSAVTFTETAADRVAWRATLTGGGIRAELDAALEFDGLITCSVNLLPADGQEAVIQDLHIDVPMNREHTTQLIANGGGRDLRKSWVARMIPTGKGRVWDGLTGPSKSFGRALKNYLPHVWLGGDVAGLYFGGDNDKGWTVNDALDEPAQEVRRRDDAVIYRMNVIREPTTITAAGRRFHFALLPTPAKPPAVDWRQKMRGEYGSPRYWFGAMDVFGGVNLNENPDNPGDGVSSLEPHSWEHAAIQSAYLRDKQEMTILMANASYARPGPAFQDWNHDLWAGTGRVAWTPEFVDYAVWAVHQYLQRGVIDGIYIDDVSVGRTMSLASTGYELEDGTRRMGFTALAQRRFLLRLWRLFEASGKTPEIGLHTTYCYEVPVFSFASSMFNGEIFDGASFSADRSFMEIWPPELLRILGNASKWGAGQQWVTHGVGSPNEHWAYFQNRALHGNYMAADVLSEGVPGTALLKAGLMDPGVRVYPFWQADEVLDLHSPAGATVVAAVYAHADRAFVLLVNYERVEQEVTVSLQENRLFPGAGVTWRDADPDPHPPAQRGASREELQRLSNTLPTGRLLDDDAIDEEGISNLLEGTTPEQRQRDRLEFKPSRGRARVVIRPRDFRILDVRPTAASGPAEDEPPAKGSRTRGGKPLPTTDRLDE